MNPDGGPDRTSRIRLATGRAAIEVAPGVGGRVSALEVDGWDLLRRDGWTVENSVGDGSGSNRTVCLRISSAGDFFST